MKKRSFTEEGVQFAWDGTSLDLIQTCLRKYYYSMIRNIQPKGKSVHLIFGGIYASALELFYKLRFDGVSIPDATNEVVLFAMRESWDREAGTPVAFNDPSNKKTRVNLIRTIVWYLEEFADESQSAITTIKLQNGSPAVELSFNFELSDDILWCGHLDRGVEMGGFKYVMDQKTTGGDIGTWWAKQFTPHNQFSGYSYAGQIIFNSPIAGVLVDGAQIAVNFSRFERHPISRSKRQLEEWRETALYSIKAAQSATMLNTWPMNATACGNYGGCPFRPLCSVDPSLREAYISQDYEEKIWDPLKER